MKQFEFTPTNLKDVFIIKPYVFEDERGYFMETFRQEAFEAMGIEVQFVQDNESKSSRGVLRGLHFQSKQAQGKLVRVIKGEIYDVAVDLRIGSPTFGKAQGFILSSENKKQLYIPAGYAHGFYVLSEEVIFNYKCTDVYAPQYESGILWNDPDLNIDWPISALEAVKLSEKDKALPCLKDIKSPFKYEEIIRGKGLVLRPIERKDIETIRLWRNIESTKKTFIDTRLISREMQVRWYENYQGNVADRMFMIELEQRAVGIIALYHIDEVTKQAEMGRLLIGDLSARGKSVGIKATKLLCEYGFNKLGLEKIKLEVFEDNFPALSVYEKIGFKKVSESMLEDRKMLEMALNKGGE